MSYREKALILLLLLSGTLLWGCAQTLQETKGTDGDTGNITQLKFTGSKVKLEHDF